MSMTPSDAYRAAQSPHNARTTLRSLDLSDAGDASIELDEGLYELHLLGGGGSLGAMIRAGASTAALIGISSGDPEVAGFHMAPGQVVTYAHDPSEGDGALHGIPDDTGSVTLLCIRKVL